MRAVLLATLVALAGCFGSSGTDDGPDPTATTTGTTGTTTTTGTSGPAAPVAMLLDFGYHDCQGATIAAAAPTSQVQAALPPGYTAVPIDGEDGTRLLYSWWLCDSFETPGALINDTVLGMVAAEATGPGGTAIFYLARMLVQDDVMAQLWTAAGYEVVVGEFTVTSLPGTRPLPDAGKTVAIGEYSFEGTLLLPTEAEAGTLPFWTETAAGRLQWTMEMFHLGALQAPTQVELVLPDDDPFGPAEVRSAWSVGDGHMTGIDLWLYRAGS